IYVAALEIAARLNGGTIDKSRVLAIGDGVATDIRGASMAGIRSVFVASGVHVPPGLALQDAAEKLFAIEAIKPVALMTALAW
ncbi:MAG: HAD hydrolase-like protein, partial [Hyphomicrobium sp.]